MKDREDLLEIEIALLQAAGRRYGLLLEQASRERRERIRKEARRAIEQARVKHGAGCPGRGGQGQGGSPTGSWRPAPRPRSRRRSLRPGPPKGRPGSRPSGRQEPKRRRRRLPGRGRRKRKRRSERSFPHVERKKPQETVPPERAGAPFLRPADAEVRPHQGRGRPPLPLCQNGETPNGAKGAQKSRRGAVSRTAKERGCVHVSVQKVRPGEL